ncbi:MAG TPA: ABC transporter permease [Anaerolineae bacterium]|nr:ABC transporter permease [Anaerolineae bacterium]
MPRRIWAVMQKEFIHILRDRRTLAILVGMPIIQLLLFGYAINMNVDHIPMVVADQSLDADSRAYVNAMVVSGFFDLTGHVFDEAQVVQAIDEGRAMAGIIISPGFAAHVQRGEAQVLFLVDGSDFFTSLSAYNAASVIAQVHGVKVLLARVQGSGLASQLASGQAAGLQGSLPLDTRIRILYNPNLEDVWFVIPAMTAVLLQIQSIALTAAAVVRERERGNIEQILVTPIRPVEFLLGKVVPAASLALVNLLTVLAVGVFWFGVPFQGDFWLFLWLSSLYVFCGLGLGLLISTVSQNQKQAQQLIGVTMLFSIVLGGFFFPLYTMPPALRLAANLFPLTHFIPIARGIITKGVGVQFMWEQVASLAVYAVIVIAISARAFRPRLD